MEACLCNETVSVSLENLLFFLGIVTFSRLSYRYIVGTSLKTVIKIVDIIQILSISPSLFHSTILPSPFILFSLSISHTELRILRQSVEDACKVRSTCANIISYVQRQQSLCVTKLEQKSVHHVILSLSLFFFFLFIFVHVSIVFRYSDPYIVIRIFDLMSLFLPFPFFFISFHLLLLPFVLFSFVFFVFHSFFIHFFLFLHACILIVTSTTFFYSPYKNWTWFPFYLLYNSLQFWAGHRIFEGSFHDFLHFPP